LTTVRIQLGAIGAGVLVELGVHLRAYPVGLRVGNVRNNDAALLDEMSVAA
jgi:hypothetical protein